MFIAYFRGLLLAHKIPLNFALFRYYYRLKRYGDWYYFSSRHFPLSPNLTQVTSSWISKLCWVDAHSLCLPFAPCHVPLVDDPVFISEDLSSYVPLFSHFCVKRLYFLEVVLALCCMSPY